jgi:hypothetical protein
LICSTGAGLAGDLQASLGKCRTLVERSAIHGGDSKEKEREPGCPPVFVESQLVERHHLFRESLRRGIIALKVGTMRRCGQGTRTKRSRRASSSRQRALHPLATLAEVTPPYPEAPERAHHAQRRFGVPGRGEAPFQRGS